MHRQSEMIRISFFLNFIYLYFFALIGQVSLIPLFKIRFMQNNHKIAKTQCREINIYLDMLHF